MTDLGEAMKEEKSLKQKAVNSVYWSFIQTVLTNGISIVTSIILARLLMPSEFGLIAMITLFVGIGNVIINGGFTQSIIRSSELDLDEINSIFTVNVILSLFIYAVVFLIAPFIADYFHQPILVGITRVYCILFVLNALSSVQSALLSKQMAFRTLTYANLPALLISGFLGIVLAYYGFKVWSLVFSAILQSSISFLHLWIVSTIKPKFSFKWNKLKTHFHFGYKLVLSGILDTVFMNVYNLIIGRRYNVSQLGYYNRADSLQMYPVNMFSSIVNKVSYPLMSEIKSDELKLKETYQKILKVIAFLITPSLLFMMVMAQPLFRVLFTDKWDASVPYFQILCITGILYPIHSYNLQILNVKGRSDLFLKLEIIKKVFFIIVLMVSLNFGIKGLLYGSVVNSIIALFINTYYSGLMINYSFKNQIIDLLPIFFLSIVTMVIVWECDSYQMQNINANNFSRLVIGALIAFILYLGGAYIFKLSSFKELLKFKN